MKAFFLSLFALMIFVFPAVAGNDGWAVSDHMRVRLLSHVSSIGKTDMLHAALEVELADGWHTYWRVSGDSGLPPRFDWGASENVGDVQVHFPAPTRKNEQGFITFGHAGRFILPLDITLIEVGAAADVRLSAQIMICKDICIPQMVEASLHVPAGGGESSPHAMVLERARDKLPHVGNSDALGIENIILGKDALVLSVRAEDFAADMDVFAVLDDEIGLTAEPEFKAMDENTVQIRIALHETLETPKGHDVSITLVNGQDVIAVEQQF